MASFKVISISKPMVCVKEGSSFNGKSFKRLEGPTVKTANEDGSHSWVSQSTIIWEDNKELYNEIAIGDTISLS